ncbi:MAG: PAS domain S-box protein [Limisphaerales bacterium]
MLIERALTFKQSPVNRSALRDGPPAYGLAAALVALAFLLRLLLDPLWGDRLPFVSFFVACGVVAQFAEAGPSVFASVAGFLLAVWFFMAPRHTLWVQDRVERVNSVFYFVLCFSVVWFSLRTRRALQREREAKAALREFAAIIESTDDAIVAETLEGRIVSWNAAAQKLFGFTAAEAIGQPTGFLLADESAADHQLLLERVGRGENTSRFETTRRGKSGGLLEVSLTVSPVRDGNGEIVAASTIARDISGRKRAERERERLVCELQAALREVKTLSGLLPICTHCKKIRDDKGCWSQIELYVRDHSYADFTHGICPECADRFFRDLPKEDLNSP